MDLFWSLSHTISSLLSYFWQVLDAISLFLVLGISGVAVYIAIQSKREAKVAAQMSLFYQHMAKYSSIEMHEALEIIGELFDTRRQNEAAFSKVVKRYLNKDFSVSALMSHVEAGTPSELFRHNYEETHQARRQVSHFFRFSFDLFSEFKVLDDVYFEKICSIDTFKFLYHVIEWLELAFNPDYARKAWTDLLEQSGREDIEDLKKQRPPPTQPELIQKLIQMMQSNQQQK